MSSLPTSDDGTPPTLFQYHPNGVAACIFIAAFGLGAIAHFVEMCWLRTWYFIPFLIGCIMDTFGYYGRFWLSQEPQNFKAYVLYMLLVLPAPIFMAASLYMAIRRIIHCLEADDFSPISPRWFSKLFVLGDVICFLVQISGTGMQVTTDAHIQHLGGIVVVVGLVFQILVFAAFIILVWRFLTTLRLQPGADSVHWKRYVVSLLAASGLIVVRNIVVGIEHAQGSDGFIATHEAITYIFEALPILLVVIIFALYQPGRLQQAVRRLPVRGRTGTEGGGDMEMRGEGSLLPKNDDRRYQMHRGSRALHVRRSMFSARPA